MTRIIIWLTLCLISGFLIAPFPVGAVISAYAAGRFAPRYSDL